MEVSSSSSDQKMRKPINVQLVMPGEVITDDITAMRGHGTYMQDGQIISAVSGIVERIGKLVSVKPLRTRYTGDAGDVVIGRVVEVSNNRWKLDVNARQYATLMIGAVNLHGGIHRRRTVDDSLQMRNYFVEDDLIVADVQSIHHDGTISLQVPKTSDVILGLNGYIWITPSLTDDEKELKFAENSEWKPGPIPKDVRQTIARVRNCIHALGILFLPVHPDTIMHLFNNSLKLSVADLLEPQNMILISEGVDNPEPIA